MKIFLSHASENAAAAESITFSLRNRGHVVFLDRDDLPAGNTYDQRIENAIKDSDLFIFLISPSSLAQGRYTLTELAFARRKWPNPNRHILPIMAVKTPFDVIPEYLKAVTILKPQGNVTAETSAAVDALASADSKAQLGEAQLSTLKDVLAACYRRAVFTRFHAQLNHEAMFKSLSECSQSLQKLISYVEPPDNKRLVARMIAQFYLIERIAARPFTSDTAGAVDSAKLKIISALPVLAKQAKTEFVLPSGITEEVFFTEEEANAPPEGSNTR